MRNPFSLFLSPDEHPHSEAENKVITAFAIVILALGTICSMAVCITSLPFTEGWYETLVYLEKHGLAAYSAVEFVLPPVTLQYFHLLDAITHSNFVGNKLLGVVLDLADVGLLYLWVRRTVSNTPALLAAGMLFILMSTEPLFIPGDYHQIVLFFLTIATMLLVSPTLYDTSPIDTRGALRVAVSGAVVQILLLTKQNVGLGLFLGYLMVAALSAIVGICRKQTTLATKSIIFAGLYILTFALAGFGFLRIFYPNHNALQLYVSFFLVGSKGSPLYATTRLLHDTNNIDTILPAFIVTALIFLATLAARYYRTAAGGFSTAEVGSQRAALASGWLVARRFTFAVLPIVLFVTGLVFLLMLPDIFLWNFWPAIFTFVCFFLDILSLIVAVFTLRPTLDEQQDRLYSAARIILFGMIIIAHSMTAAISSIALQLFFGYYAAFALHHAIRAIKKTDVAWQGLSIAASFLILSIYFAKLELTKLDIPYGWWGMQEPPIYASSIKMNQPYLAGARVSEDRAYMINSIVSTVDTQTNPGDPILAYPDIPFFYMLTNRLPETKTYVQWFDFATNEALIPDFLHISEAPPKVVVEMSVPQDVYIGHESLLGRMVPQRPFSEYLQCMVDVGAYKELDRFFYNRSNALEGTYNLRTSTAISAEGVDEIAALAVHYPSASYVVTGALGLDDSVVSLPEIQKIADQKSGGFGGIVVKGNSNELPEFLKYLTSQTHIKLTPADDNFILRTLKRENDWSQTQGNCPLRLQKALALLGQTESGDQAAQ